MRLEKLSTVKDIALVIHSSVFTYQNLSRIDTPQKLYLSSLQYISNFYFSVTMSRPTTPQSLKSATRDPAALEELKAAERPPDDTKSKVNALEQKLSSPRTVALLISVFLSMFLVAVDRTIISTVSNDDSVPSLLSG